jgi:hypothetical protein
LVTGLAALVTADDKGDKPVKKPKGKITIGKETTYVAGPLDENGYIDYTVALNARLGKGVTAANNPNVLIWNALVADPRAANH